MYKVKGWLPPFFHNCSNAVYYHVHEKDNTSGPSRDELCTQLNQLYLLVSVKKKRELAQCISKFNFEFSVTDIIMLGWIDPLDSQLHLVSF